jgi:hypothetical protein
MARIQLGCALVACLSMGLLPGCAEKSKLASVSGTVTYKGQLLKGGRVMFKPAEPGGLVDLAYARIQEDGNFKLNEAPIGRILVAIDTDHIEEQIDPGLGEAYLKQKVSERYVKIPPHYKDFKSSGLAIDLQPGLNQPQELELK